MAHSHRERVNDIMEVATYILEIGTHLFKKSVKQRAQFMQSAVETTWFKHIGNKPVTLHEADRRDMVTVETCRGNQSGNKYLAVADSPSNIFLMAYSLHNIID